MSYDGTPMKVHPITEQPDPQAWLIVCPNGSYVKVTKHDIGTLCGGVLEFGTRLEAHVFTYPEEAVLVANVVWRAYGVLARTEPVYAA